MRIAHRKGRKSALRWLQAHRADAVQYWAELMLCSTEQQLMAHRNPAFPGGCPCLYAGGQWGCRYGSQSRKNVELTCSLKQWLLIKQSSRIKIEAGWRLKTGVFTSVNVSLQLFKAPLLSGYFCCDFLLLSLIFGLWIGGFPHECFGGLHRLVLRRVTEAFLKTVEVNSSVTFARVVAFE